MYQIQRQAILKLRSRRSLSLRYRDAAQFHSSSDGVRRKDAQCLLKRRLSTMPAVAVSEQSTNATTMKILHMIRSFRNRGTKRGPN
jgi:hypothetical protein